MSDELKPTAENFIAFCEMVDEIGMPEDTIIPVWPRDTEMAYDHPLTVGIVKVAQAELTRLREALKKISSQFLTPEIEKHYGRESANSADYEAGYNAIIEIAREALAKYKGGDKC